MGIALGSSAAPMDIRALHRRMGSVYHQPVRVRSFTNKRFTVNFRVPLEQLRRVVPGPIELDEIGGNAPSAYLAQIQRDKAVQLDPAAMDAILRTHSIDPGLLRADDFDGFFQNRKAALLSLIERAMGKQAILTDEPTPEDAADSEDLD